VDEKGDSSDLPVPEDKLHGAGMKGSLTLSSDTGGKGNGDGEGRYRRRGRFQFLWDQKEELNVDINAGTGIELEVGFSKFMKPKTSQ